MDLARQERTDLADYLTTLEPFEWDAPSLCHGWSVRDVVAHIVSYEELSLAQLAPRFAKGRFVPARINSVGVQEYNSQNGEVLVGTLRRWATPRGLTAGFGGAIALTDTLIHHQDIRLALGHRRDVPHERLKKALPFAMVAPPIRGAWIARGLRVVAVDMGWEFGRGREVKGSGQALLMAVAGRTATLDDLTGPGVEVLRRRLA